mmetsp:Transcript_10304/g.27010  ORF Transcript_10304/g.27010 Transcript_10304/m.27010 type:complete len:419 (-) Transcript_10304:404-1660(-)
MNAFGSPESPAFPPVPFIPTPIADCEDDDVRFVAARESAKASTCAHLRDKESREKGARGKVENNLEEVPFPPHHCPDAAKLGGKSLVQYAKEHSWNKLYDSIYAEAQAMVACRSPSRFCTQEGAMSGPISSISFGGPDDRYLVSSSLAGNVTVWDPFLYRSQRDDEKKLQKCASLDLEGVGVRHAGITAGKGTWIFHTASADGTCRLFDGNTLEPKWAFRVESSASVLRPHPQEHGVYAIGTEKEGLIAVDEREKKVVRSFKREFGAINDFVFINGGKEVMTCAEVPGKSGVDLGVIVWDWRSGQKISNQIFLELYSIQTLRLAAGQEKVYGQCSGDYIISFQAKKPYRQIKKKVSFVYPRSCLIQLTPSSNLISIVYQATVWALTSLLTKGSLHQARQMGLSTFMILVEIDRCGSFQ